ncbi:MAG: hypothetical protein EAZ84_08790 [Verrucomicrobia bacterium]|nr:MAG: hypothetical protein EAZ84_08790 [Verrucomicrobiota bacterium]TAE88750.1 MAG: hypothetical protein EAZ82_03360 [Verrucomicrobiota bacterium]TAF26551.1 MAG: hypothetical protein EAZ71_04885 [Verrucomicrobiota bacterium]
MGFFGLLGTTDLGWIGRGARGLDFWGSVGDRRVSISDGGWAGEDPKIFLESGKLAFRRILKSVEKMRDATA